MSKNHARITARQGLIEDSARLLARHCGVSSFQTYRQNVWVILDKALNMGSSARRKAYYAHLSPLGKTRLWNAVAKQALIEDRRNNPTFPLKMGLPLIVGSSQFPR